MAESSLKVNTDQYGINTASIRHQRGQNPELSRYRTVFMSPSKTTVTSGRREDPSPASPLVRRPLARRKRRIDTHAKWASATYQVRVGVRFRVRVRG